MSDVRVIDRATGSGLDVDFDVPAGVVRLLRRDAAAPAEALGLAPEQLQRALDNGEARVGLLRTREGPQWVALFHGDRCVVASLELAD